MTSSPDRRAGDDVPGGPAARLSGRPPRGRTASGGSGGLEHSLGRWARRPQAVPGVVLSALAVLLALGMWDRPEWVAPSAFLLLLLVAVFVLRWLALVVVAALVSVLALTLWAMGSDTMTPGTIVVLAAAVGAVLIFGRNRERLGLQGAPSGLMLVDLRDRLEANGHIPPLPAGWRVDAVVRSAHQDAFSGDFVVARAPADDVLEVVLVDVSGKGQAVGVRSLQLSGALAGLLGAMAPADFLPAANSYLLGQGWDDGFATAAHLALDLRTGAYQVATAGHLPPVQLHAGSGRVSVVDTVGAPVLGVTPDFRCQARTGTLQPGDALLLYTDGLVETRGGDLDQGIDRLLGVLEQLVSTGRGGADAVLAAARRQEDDDRALVLVQRA
ncbi:MAG: serine/threonine protein phosphatase [Cellulomonas sp. 14-74-6]|jgi:hypothetical protein|nr:MAG: serine/threonine protein phosphatase [Cellulomonas sp. 14-74-6]